jgi:hypothetical protein
MFKMLSTTHPRREALLHLGEIAHWSTILCGWISLGEQGMLSSGPSASGVIAIALWWSMRLLCRGSSWILQCSSLTVGLMSLATALGLFGLTASNSAHSYQVLLFGLAALWGVWCAMLETRTQSSAFAISSFAWHPLISAFLVYACWQYPIVSNTSHPSVVCLIGVCAVVLFLRDQHDFLRKKACQSSASTHHSLLAPSSMGLMMGTMWLSDAWCVGAGLENHQMVLIHLVLMAGLPCLVSYVARFDCVQSTLKPHALTLSHILLVAGSVSLFGSGWVFKVLSMLLPSLAWALHCARLIGPRAKVQRAHIRITKMISLMMGPLLLMWVGYMSPALGPMAFMWAMGCIGVLAAAHMMQRLATHGEDHALSKVPLHRPFNS